MGIHLLFFTVQGNRLHVLLDPSLYKADISHVIHGAYLIKGLRAGPIMLVLQALVIRYKDMLNRIRLVLNPDNVCKTHILYLN